MVCNRCIMVVEDTLEQLGIVALEVKLGEVRTKQALDANELRDLDMHLNRLGFALIDDRKGQLIEQVKKIIIRQVHYQDAFEKRNLSEVLSEELQHDYNYLSNLYSEVEGSTIEKYYIAQKIERVKELLVYDELSLSEIAHSMSYSSVAYLSNQFKKVTGLSPSHFKQIKADKRKPLDEV